MRIKNFILHASWSVVCMHSAIHHIIQIFLYLVKSSSDAQPVVILHNFYYKSENRQGFISEYDPLSLFFMIVSQHKYVGLLVSLRLGIIIYPSQE